MSTEAGLCYLVVAVATIAFVIYGFMQILGKQLPTETDTQVIQRQIKGFAFLMLSQLILVMGSGLCAGMGFSLRDAQRSLKL